MEYPLRGQSCDVRCTKGILLIIFNQDFRFIHIVTLTPPSNAQGYTVRRHDDAVLRGAVGAEDDGARVAIHIQLVPPHCLLTKLGLGIFL